MLALIVFLFTCDFFFFENFRVFLESIDENIALMVIVKLNTIRIVPIRMI
jgi:hypothetical protein